MTKTAVCICSGGIDSTVAATIAANEGYELHLVHASYGQRAEVREKEAVKKIARYLGLMENELKFVEIPFLTVLGTSALIDPWINVPLDVDVDLNEERETPQTWVPCRNLVLLAHASAYAEVIGAEAIFAGFNAEEARSYPDNGVEFVKRYNALLEEAVASFSRVPSVKAPLISLFKPEIIKKGYGAGAPLHSTYSCYLGDAAHCGSCESCLRRKRGFKEAGVEDPTVYH
ncbi:MAG: 7-cyano-7-deazaguanine synthase QueC [Methanophagales archaeon]|nr:7-cyano-7-deazaguanine synthase QueC [Methanophagales archaeon]